MGFPTQNWKLDALTAWRWRFGFEDAVRSVNLADEDWAADVVKRAKRALARGADFIVLN